MRIETTDDQTLWKSALSLYDKDQVVEAFELVRGISIGPLGLYLSAYRLLEAEAVSRGMSTRISLSEYLDLEYVHDEVNGDLAELWDRIESSCKATGDEFNWSPEYDQKILISILAKETDAPWSLNPYGYFVQKQSVGKICLPPGLLAHPRELVAAVRHEYAHAVSSLLSHGKAPRWLNEAVSVLLEQPGQVFPGERFVRSPALWLDPADLEAVLTQGVMRPRSSSNNLPGFPDLLNEDIGNFSPTQVMVAYEQCGVIGQYLNSRGGKEKLRELLEKLASGGGIRSAVAALVGRSPSDVALRLVYGFGELELFEHAKRNLNPK